MLDVGIVRRCAALRAERADEFLKPFINVQMTSFTSNQMLVLSRLASLKGQVVSYKEFKSFEKYLDQKELIGVPLEVRISTLWRSRFLLGIVKAIEYPPRSEDFPLLWIPPKSHQLSMSTLIIIGIDSSLKLIYLNEKGKSLVLSKEDCQNGQLLAMDCYPPYDSRMLIEKLEKSSKATLKKHVHLVFVLLIFLLIISLSTFLIMQG